MISPGGPLFLLASQITTNAEIHDLNKERLERVVELAPADAVLWPVVFAPKGVNPWILVPTASQTVKFFGTRSIDEALFIGHSHVDLAKLYESF